MEGKILRIILTLGLLCFHLINAAELQRMTMCESKCESMCNHTSNNHCSSTFVKSVEESCYCGCTCTSFDRVQWIMSTGFDKAGHIIGSNVQIPLPPPQPLTCENKEEYCLESYCHGENAVWGKINCQKTCGYCPPTQGNFSMTNTYVLIHINKANKYY